MNIYPIVVTYCVDFESSAVYKTLLRYYPDCEFLIYDNSPKPINKVYQNAKISYIHNEANGGVTIAYNTGAKLARGIGKSHIVMFDQDTFFDRDYLNRLEKAITDHPGTYLFVPAVFYKGKIPFSPVRFKLFSIKPEQLKPGEYSLFEYIPVNSGACVKLDAYENSGGYNGEIKLDFADFDFFQRLSKVSSNFCLLDSQAFQQFSNTETETRQLMKRFCIYINDANHYKGKRFIGIHVLRHTLALSFRSKSIHFILYYIKHYLLHL